MLPIVKKGCDGWHSYIVNYLHELNEAYSNDKNGDLKITARLTGFSFAVNTNTMIFSILDDCYETTCRRKCICRFDKRVEGGQQFILSRAKKKNAIVELSHHRNVLPTAWRS